MKPNRLLSCCLALLCLLPVVGCAPSPSDSPKGGGTGAGATKKGESVGAADAGKSGKPTIAFVTNGIASFWVIAEKGARAAARDADCNIEIRMPSADGAVANQKRMVEELLAMKVDGIAISPIDPDNQTDLLNEAASQTKLVTQDADAPQSKRLAYIGMDNYEAGRMCGALVKEAIPNGGKVVLFVGRLEQLNARLRRQGTIDELLDRSRDPKRYDDSSGELKGDKYTILDTRTDNFDFAAAKALPEDALSRYPDVDCLVGLFAYNPPYILEAVRGANKLGKVKVVGFDEDEATLQAIKDGHCFGTVVQNPYRYGYDSVRLLADLARGTAKELPPSRFFDIAARSIRRDNVDAFWDELKKLTAEDSPAPAADKDATAKEAPTSDSTSKTTDPKVKVAFVTNNASDFWKIAEAGVRKGEKAFNAECEVLLPANGTADDQQQIIEALMARGVAGMAISPNDAENQVDIINRAAETMAVITHDSDAPKSNRLAYVGTNNFKAGQEAGKLIKEALPDGGKIMMFVGRIDAQNALDRANGIKDVLKDTKVEVLDIRIDLTDRARAKQNVEDTLNQYPDIGCLVGLWSYNGPAILEAVRDAGRLGKTPIVCFDEEDATLQGVLDGHIRATVVQQPFEFGFQAVRVLAALARKQDAKIPDDKIVDVPVQVVRGDNVKAFWDRLKNIKAGTGE